MIGRGHRGRTDANHTAIVKALRQVGASVQSLASVGRGCPDLLVGFLDVTHLIEVKDGANGLTSHEQAWVDSWRGQSVRIAYSVADALAIIGVKS